MADLALPQPQASQEWIEWARDLIRSMGSQLQVNKTRPITAGAAGSLVEVAIDDGVLVIFWDIQPRFDISGFPTNRDTFLEYFNTGNAGVSYVETLKATNINIGSVSPSVLKDKFAAEFRGLVYTPDSGEHQFGLDVDAEAELIVEATVVIQKFTAAAKVGNLTATTGTIELTRGWHPFLLRWLEGTGVEGIDLGWKKPTDSAIAVIPAANFGSPLSDIYTGELHHFEVEAAGLSANAQRARVLRDGASLWDPASAGLSNARSYNFLVYNLTTRKIEINRTYDVFGNAFHASRLVGDITEWTGRYLKLAFNMGAAFANDFNYWDNTEVADYIIASGDQVRYDIYWEGSNAQIAFDYGTLDSVTLRDSGAVDQNGLGVHPSTNLDAQALNKWYARTINIPAGHVGKQITSYMFACENNGGGTLTGRIRNLRITDTANVPKLVIWNGFTPALTLTEITDADGDNTLTATITNSQPGDDYALVIFTADDPQPNRTQYALPEALAFIGATRTVIEAAEFLARAAYILVGTPNLGEGNGIERYAGTIDNDPQAFAGIIFQTRGNKIVALSGTGWSPDMNPGPPTNNPTPTAITQTVTDTGHRADKIEWTYTQPALSGNNKPADGFILYYQSGDTATAAGNEIKLGPAVRDYTFHWSHDQTDSYAIAAYRRTASGIEVGPKQTSGAAPDWQGRSSAGLITTPGVGDDQITTSKRQLVNSQSISVAVTGLSGAGIGFTHNLGKVQLVTMEYNHDGGFGQFHIIGTMNDATINTLGTSFWNHNASTATVTGFWYYW